MSESPNGLIKRLRENQWGPYASLRREAANALEQMKSAGWRACIDHIIKPESPCPVCRIEQLEAAQQLQRVTAEIVTQQDELLNMHSERIEQLEAVVKATKTFMVQYNIVTDSSEWKGIWTFLQTHGQPYRGPEFGDELEGIELALQSAGDSTPCKTCGDTGCPFPEHRDMCSIHHCPDCEPQTKKQRLWSHKNSWDDPGSGRIHNCPRCGDPFPSWAEKHDHYMRCTFVGESIPDSES